MNNLRLAATLFAGTALLAGCQQVPAPAQAPVAPPPAPVQAEPAPPPEPAAPPVVPYPAAQIPKAILNAMSLLDNGKEDLARVELQRILAGDPNNAKAKHLMSQITGDPQAMLGKESFAYTVRPNESMSTLAGRFLGDITSFYVLARYNGIAVPRQLAAGQVLRIPGKAPPPSASPPPPPAPPVPVPAAPPVAETPAPAASVPAPAPPPPPGARALQQGQAAEARGDLEGAYGAYQQAAAANEPGAPARADAVRKKLVQRYSLGARTAFARQDLDGAIKGWDSVLAVDPDNETAKLERQRALTLKAKVDSLKK